MYGTTLTRTSSKRLRKAPERIREAPKPPEQPQETLALLQQQQRLQRFPLNPLLQRTFQTLRSKCSWNDTDVGRKRSRRSNLSITSLCRPSAPILRWSKTAPTCTRNSRL